MMKTTQIIKKSQKPIDFDIFLKYVCPSCHNDHWIKYLAATTKNFKIVCDCGAVFRIKRVCDFKLKYEIKNKNKTSNNLHKIPDELLRESIRVISGYGFSKSESKELVEKAYLKNPVDTVVNLVKQSLELARNNNE